MVSAVQFNHEPSLKAAEIRKEIADRVIAAKVRTIKSPAIEHVPELSLGVGSVMAATARLESRLEEQSTPARRLN